MSPACWPPILKIPFMPSCLSEGASTTATRNPCAANLSRLRTRKFPAPQLIDDADLSPSAPWPPANRMTEATGLSGLIRMKACFTPRGVWMETSSELAACAGADAAASIAATTTAAISLVMAACLDEPYFTGSV